MTPCRIWTRCRLIVSLVLLIFGLAACASYPSEPKSPDAKTDEYTVEEDGFLTVPANEGVLTNDLAGEGVDMVLTTIGELPTENGGTVIMAEDGGFTFKPGVNFFGADQATYSIRNNKSKTSAGTIILNVTPINDPPVISPIADQTTPQNSAIDIAVTVSDLETAPADLIITTMSGNTALVPDDGMTIGGDGSQRILTVRPAADRSGVVSITITVSDGATADALSAQATFILTIAEMNTSPTIAPIADQTTPWMTAITIPILIGDLETPVDQLALTGSSSDQQMVPDGNIVFSGSGPARSVTITPADFQIGDLRIQIRVSDSGDSTGSNQLSAETSFRLTISFPILPFSAPVPAVLLTAQTSSEQYQLESNMNHSLLVDTQESEGQPLGATSTEILQEFFSGRITVEIDGGVTYELPTGFTDADPMVESQVDQILSPDSLQFPLVEPDHYVILSARGMDIPANQGLLANDLSELQLTIADPGDFSTLFGGIITLRHDGAFRYQPPSDFHGTDGFVYRVTNGLNAVAGVVVFSIAP